ncbi:thioredoxin family protein [Candidatus Micrarchaeota archaeon]|nr:thioredoxin family protein [Candidatus Micrarchaeota archaeon]MBU1930405.1 thioredoxin family protein [Candidatus Micrarchaeota archaeon]
MNRYLEAGVITIALLAVIFSVIGLLDNSRISSLDMDVEHLNIQSESNRILFFYNQVFTPEKNPEYCEIINQSATLRSDEADFLFSRLVTFEEANLMGNYENLKKRYLLSRIELWLYTTLLADSCETNMVPILYFYTGKKTCVECSVQGGILDDLRRECPNVKIFALSVDEDIDLVPLLQAQFGVTTVPSLVINNEQVFSKLTTKEELLNIISCGEIASITS